MRLNPILYYQLYYLKKIISTFLGAFLLAFKKEGTRDTWVSVG